jgi:hypothetical protein
VAGICVAVATFTEGAEVGATPDATVAAVAWLMRGGTRPRKTSGATMLNAAMIASDTMNRTARTLFFIELPPIAGQTSAPDRRLNGQATSSRGSSR